MEPPVSYAASDPPLDAARMLAAIRRNAWLIVAIVALVTGVSLAISLRTPEQFQARARLAAAPSSGAATDPNAVDRDLASSQVLATSPSVLAAAARQLPGQTAGSLAGSVSAAVDSTAGMVDVLATDRDPRLAARMANTVANTFLASRADAERRQIQAARAGLQAQLAGLSKTDAAGPLGDALRQQISQLTVSAVTPGSSLSLAEPASIPSAPYAPRPLRNALLAAVAGLLLACMAAVVRERLRRQPTDLGSLAVAAGLPLLAVLPDGPAPERSGWRRLLPHRREAPDADAPTQQVTLGEGALQGSIRAALPPTSPRGVLVCGVAPDQGQDSVAFALMRALTWAGSTATLLNCWDNALATDADLEKARRDGNDYVILDMPAVSGWPDLQLVSWQLDGALLVAGAQRATAAEVAAAAQLLHALGVHVLGLVVTAPPSAVPAAPLTGFAPAARPPASPEPERDAPRRRLDFDPLHDLPIAAGGAPLWTENGGPDEGPDDEQTRD